MDVKNLREETKSATPNDRYKVFAEAFDYLPERIKEHRYYFEAEGRGFGERAFHTMWYTVFEELSRRRLVQSNITQLLEIGVFRGQVISLFALLCEHFEMHHNLVYGIGPLEAVNDSVSRFPENIDYYEDILKNFKALDISTDRLTLVKASSIAKEARTEIKSFNWDIAYIDGNHDLPFVLADYCNVAEQVREFLVIDDSSLELEGFNVEGAFKGHVGPSMVADQLAAVDFDHWLNVGHNNVYTINR